MKNSVCHQVEQVKKINQKEVFFQLDLMHLVEVSKQYEVARV